MQPAHHRAVTRPPAVVAAAVLLAAGTLLLYVQVRAHAFLRFDDPAYVTANPWVQAGLTRAGLAWAFTTFHAANWHPLTWLSLMADVEVFGVDAGASLLVNAALHALNAALLLLALHRLTRAPVASALVAALFAVHPLHVESVAWIAERKDVLSTAFGFAALWAYARYAERPRPGAYLAVAALLALSLLAKPMLVTLPFLLLLLDFWPLRRWRPWGDAGGAPAVRLVAEKLPLLALSAGSSVVTWLAQSRSDAIAPASSGVLERLAFAAIAYVRYLGQAVSPVSLGVYYPVPPGGHGAWAGIGAAAVLVGVSAVAVASLRRAPWLAVGWSWYLGTLVPVIGLVRVGSQAGADRYTYVPLVGLFVAVTWQARAALDAAPARVRTAAAALAVAVVAALAGLTYRQLGFWRDHETLFLHTLEVTGPNAAAHASLSGFYGDAGDVPRALAHAAEAVRIDPSHALGLVNLAAALRQVGRREEALEASRRATVVAPRDASAWLALGAAERELGRADDARAALARSIALDGGDPRAWTELGSVELARGDAAAAVEALRRPAELAASDPRSWFNLGFALGAAGRTREAVEAYARALELRPQYGAALRNLSVSCAALGAEGARLLPCARAARALRP